MPDITGVIRTIAVADVLVGTQLQERAAGQKADQLAKWTEKSAPYPAPVNQSYYHCRQGN
jgi:hypothetical protein